MIPARIHIVTLGVADLPRSRAFYEALGWPVSESSNDDIVWFQLGGALLGLFGSDALAEDATVTNEPAAGFRATTLAINLGSREEVDSAYRAALDAGAREVKRPVDAVWGGYSGYFADPDGHLWEIAHNPFAGFNEDGSLQL